MNSNKCANIIDNRKSLERVLIKVSPLSICNENIFRFFPELKGHFLLNRNSSKVFNKAIIINHKSIIIKSFNIVIA